MKNVGYVTSNFGKWHIGNDPVQQGVDVNIGGSGKGNPGREGYFSPYQIDFIEDGPTGEYLTDRLTNEAIQFINQQRDTSFFLYLPYYTVHTPIMGKQNWITHYKGKIGHAGHNNPTYGAMISALDENVGRLIHHLKKLNLYRDCLFMLTSDNGGLQRVTKQYPLRAGKGSYYEGGIRVPFVIKWTGKVLKNKVNSSRISQLDLYPTLQEILQPSQKALALSGQSLLPLFQGESWKNRSLYFHFPIYLQSSFSIEGLRDPLFRTRPGSVIIDGDWKLHHYFEEDGIELYHLKEDEGERNNVAQQYPNLRDSLFKKLELWRQTEDAAMPTASNTLYDPIFEQQKMQEKTNRANQVK